MRIADSACVLTRIVVLHKDFHVTHVRTVSVEELDAMAKSYLTRITLGISLILGCHSLTFHPDLL